MHLLVQHVVVGACSVLYLRWYLDLDLENTLVHLFSFFRGHSWFYRLRSFNLWISFIYFITLYFVREVVRHQFAAK